MSKKRKHEGNSPVEESLPDLSVQSDVNPDRWTIAEHRERLLKGKRGREYWALVAQHEAAATAHGWRAQAYDYPTKPMRITREDYQLAIRAACVTGDGSSPHTPALYKREA